MSELTQNPPRAPLPSQVIEDFKSMVASTAAFTADEIEWVESILSRNDGADGYAQLTQAFMFQRHDQGENLYAACKAFNETKEKLTAVERHEAITMLQRLMWSKRTSMYRQKKILVAAPQRKKHAKYDVPNLYNWEGAGQHVNTQLLAVYGLDYVEARAQCVKTALGDPDATHILFVDDDVILPKDFARVLIDTGLPSVAGLYTKKSTAFQSNATTSDVDGEFILNQKVVDPKQGDMTPVPATCVGGGMWLLSLDLFRKLPEPWFAIIGGNQGIKIGEDSVLVQRLAAYGVQTHVIPGLCGVHVDFLTGKHYGPDWLVDPTTLKLRPEAEPHLHPFPDDLDLKELVAADVKDFFGKNLKLVEQGVIKAEDAKPFDMRTGT